MQAQAFYLSLMVITLVGLATFLPQNSITGFVVGDCPGCGALCDDTNECSDGLICCPTQWETGICHEPRSCAAMAQLSETQTLEEYTTPETPRSLKNVAWKNFGMPLLAIFVCVAAVIYFGRKSS